MDYERSAQEAFNGRRVLALCSYDVTRLGTPREIDVFQHHHFRVCRIDHFLEADERPNFSNHLKNPSIVSHLTHEQVQIFRCH